MAEVIRAAKFPVPEEAKPYRRGRITTTGAFLAASLIVAGSAYAIPIRHVYHFDYALTSEALVICPVDNQEWADAATKLYFDPLGFNGTTMTVTIPEYILGDNLEKAVGVGVQDLVNAVETQYNAGAIGATDPLYIFGYSQSGVEAALAEQQLADYGIPSSDLHFVLVGDSASADGGFLNTFVSSLPEWLQQFATNTLENAGLGDVLGATTPDDLYPTDVYSLSGDGWANWDDGANILGMFTDHLEYLGLTPAEISSATLSLVDNLTNYYTIDSADVNGLSALWESFLIAVSVF
jgi:PE-PPE domain